MKTMKKHGMALALLLAMACTGHAQPAQDAGNYPARPVTLIVPTAAAGGTDTIARVFAEGLTRLLRQPFVVDNRPGANGRSEEHTSELQSRPHLVCRLLLEKKKKY